MKFLLFVAPVEQIQGWEMLSPPSVPLCLQFGSVSHCLGAVGMSAGCFSLLLSIAEDSEGHQGHSLSAAPLPEQEQSGFSIVLCLLAASHESRVTASLSSEWLLVSGMCHFGSNLVM